jgi:hypothetical protein
MFLGTLHGLKKDEEHHEFYTLHRFLPAFELDPAAHDAAGDGAGWGSVDQLSRGRQAGTREEWAPLPGLHAHTAQAATAFSVTLTCSALLGTGEGCSREYE